jgi:hypothetical protein
MTQNIITAGDATNGALIQQGGNDGTIVVQVGPSGGKVNALTLDATGNPTWARGAGSVASSNSVASTSGTSIDFTGVPSWVKRITLCLAAVSTNGTSAVQVQLGAGSVTTSGYACVADSSTTGVLAAPFTSGFVIERAGNGAVGNARSGIIELAHMGGNIWVCKGLVANPPTPSMSFFAGSLSLGATLDRLRVTTINGTDTFDAGNINILYE